MFIRTHAAAREGRIVLAALLAATAGLAGCAVSRTTPTAVSPASITLRGRARGGQQPVSGSSIQLWAAGSAGNASAATPLLTTAVLTDNSGSFNITADYTCPTAGTQVYLTATGGNPGLNNNASNPALTLVTALGDCANLPGTPSVTINEVTTVAAAVALSPFASSTSAIGATSTNATGLRTAMLNAMTLADSFNGSSPAAAINPNATVESAKLYTLANLLASCVNSDGTSVCSRLFQDATLSGPAPADTFALALHIAQHPGDNVQQLFNDIPAQTAFGANLTQTPADWTVSIAYTGGGMNSPTALALDAGGNVWVSNVGNTLSEFSPQGVSLQGSGITGSALENSIALAFDSSQNLWVANLQSVTNSGQGTVSRFDGNGTSLSGHNGISSGAINLPIALAADANGNTWIANAGSSVITLFDSTGSLISGINGFGGGTLSSPSALAVDASHNVWVASRSNGVVAQFDGTGNLLQQVALPSTLPDSMARDSAGLLWVGDNANSTLSVIAPNGTVLAAAQSGANIDRPNTLMIDAGDKLFATNYVRNTVAVVAASNGPGGLGTVLSTTQGFGLDAAMHQPFASAADSAGTLWVTSLGDNRLIAFPGLATPTHTPVLGQPQLP